MYYCLLFALFCGTYTLKLTGREAVPGGPEEFALTVREAFAETSFDVEQLEGGGMLIAQKATHGTHAHEDSSKRAASLLWQLSVPIASLGLGTLSYFLLPQYPTLAQLLVFFGAQAFMNLYMKAILSNSVVSEQLHMRGFQAPLVLTALQQLVGFTVLVVGVLASQFTPWAYKPKKVDSVDQIVAILALAVCFTLNIALNNFSLSLLDMSVNVMIRSASPLSSLILQLIFRRWFDDPSIDMRPQKVGMMLLGVIFALLVVVSKQSGTRYSDSADTNGLGLILCVASLLASSMELIVVVILSKGCKLNPIDSLLYMAMPVFLLLMLPVFFVKHPVAYPNHPPSTDWSVLLEIVSLSPGTVALVLLSGVWALGYNLLLYNIVKGLSPYFASFAANFNKVAAIGLALLMGMETLPHGGWGYLMIMGVLGNMVSFTAYSLWPSRPREQSAAADKESKLTAEKVGQDVLDQIERNAQAAKSVGSKN